MEVISFQKYGFVEEKTRIVIGNAKNCEKYVDLMEISMEETHTAEIGERMMRYWNHEKQMNKFSNSLKDTIDFAN